LPAAAFWDGVSANLNRSPFLKVPGARQWFNEIASNSVMTFGVPGFFRPGFPGPVWHRMEPRMDQHY